MRSSRARRVLELLLLGYAQWSFASLFARSEDAARLYAVRAVEWWFKAAAEAGERMPLGLQVLPARLGQCWQLPDIEMDACIQGIENEIQEWFIFILRKVVQNGGRSKGARGREEAQGARAAV